VVSGCQPQTCTRTLAIVARGLPEEDLEITAVVQRAKATGPSWACAIRRFPMRAQVHHERVLTVDGKT